MYVSYYYIIYFIVRKANCLFYNTETIHNEIVCTIIYKACANNCTTSAVSIQL